jgi:hypothetical protein
MLLRCCFTGFVSVSTMALADPTTIVTLDELRSHPTEYAGRTVSVSGQLDQCFHYGCHLCPLDAVPERPQWERCLAISFDHFRGDDGNVGADIDGDASDLT